MAQCETFGDGSLQNWEYLCAGGFGLVYKANHKDLGIAVVIKLLGGDDGSGTLYAALCREAEYMKAADHQYVPRVYGMYEGCPPNMGSTKRHGIVMELMEGGSLQSFQETLSEPPPWPLAFRLAHQVALAMEYLHSKNDLVHMDLKPANILLDADFNAKIADFGLSTVSNSVRSTDGKNKGGTLSYTPPEAFGDGYRRVRSYDVYSYGILLWTILTGETPYPVGADKALLTFRIQMGDRPDLHKIDDQKAAGFEDLVDLMTRCWDPEPNKRPLFGECVEVTNRVFSRHEGGFDILKQLTQDIKTKEKNLEGVKRVLKVLKGMLYPQAGPVPPGSSNRDDFLKHSSPLSWDPNTASCHSLLSEDDRKVTFGQKNKPDHPERFARYPNVLSRESLSERSYFEVKWSGQCFNIAVSYKDINRKEETLSRFGQNDKSWGLNISSPMGRQDCSIYHNSMLTPIHPSRPFPITGGAIVGVIVGVYVDHSAGILSFYCVHGNRMRLLHTERTTFTQPLYAGIEVHGMLNGSNGTAELCKIW